MYKEKFFESWIRQVGQLGCKMLLFVGNKYVKIKYFLQVFEIVCSVMNQVNNDIVKDFFIKCLNELDMYFIDKLIFVNELDENVFNFCSFEEGVKKYCLKCWEVMQKWIVEVRKVCGDSNVFVM